MKKEQLVGLAIVLACLIGVLGLGLALKAPCASGDWDDGRQYLRLCYSDFVPLYSTEQLGEGRLPYLDPCEPGTTCDEYPLLSMYTMWFAARFADSISGFFYANVVILFLLAVATTAALYLMVGYRALYFAAAPTLLIYGFLNWDLIAVAAAVIGVLLYLQRNDLGSGAALGIGAAAKLFPAFLAAPLALGRLERRRIRDGAIILGATAGVWAILNVPFALASFDSWYTFFRFNADRVADFDSLWFIGCHRLVTEQAFCDDRYTGFINAASLLGFVSLSALVYAIKRWRHPDFPRWTLMFPILVIFLLLNKVYSPQYSLWLLPGFALVLNSVPLFVAFELADIWVFVTRFSYFGTISGLSGGSIEAFQVAVVARAIVLVACLVAYVRRPAVPLEGTFARGARVGEPDDGTARRPRRSGPGGETDDADPHRDHRGADPAQRREVDV
jgi:uncharacterized membrane protein